MYADIVYTDARAQGPQLGRLAAAAGRFVSRQSSRECEITKDFLSEPRVPSRALAAPIARRAARSRSSIHEEEQLLPRLRASEALGCTHTSDALAHKGSRDTPEFDTRLKAGSARRRSVCLRRHDERLRDIRAPQ